MDELPADKISHGHMKLAYTAGAYRAPTPHGIVENIRRAESVALELWRLGYAVICPHKNTALFDGAAPDDVWLKGDLVMMERCDLVVVVPGWKSSSGTRAEIEHAMAREIPVYFWELDNDRATLRALANQGDRRAKPTILPASDKESR